jgi:hypothetical protein
MRDDQLESLGELFDRIQELVIFAEEAAELAGDIITKIVTEDPFAFPNFDGLIFKSALRRDPSLDRNLADDNDVEFPN